MANSEKFIQTCCALSVGGINAAINYSFDNRPMVFRLFKVLTAFNSLRIITKFTLHTMSIFLKTNIFFRSIFVTVNLHIL